MECFIFWIGIKSLVKYGAESRAGRLVVVAHAFCVVTTDKRAMKSQAGRFMIHSLMSALPVSLSFEVEEYMADIQTGSEGSMEHLACVIAGDFHP